MSTLVTLGEGLGVVRSTEPGGFGIAGAAVVGTGGAEANVAIAAARLGVAARWVGRVGSDALGRRIVRELRAEGVEVRAATEAAAPTGLLVKDAPRPGESRVVYYRTGSAGARLGPDDIERTGLASGDVLHLTGITPALSPGALDAVRAAIARARDVGARVSFDVNHRARLWSADDARPVYRELVAASDIVLAGADEAALVLGAGGPPEALARGISALGPAEVAIKLGADGAGALSGDRWRARPAAAVSVIDTVGAGDAFAGAYLAALLLGRDPGARLDAAARNGAAACTHPGDWEGSATWAELDAFELGGDPVAR